MLLSLQGKKSLTWLLLSLIKNLIACSWMSLEDAELVECRKMQRPGPNSERRSRNCPWPKILRTSVHPRFWVGLNEVRSDRVTRPKKRNSLRRAGRKRNGKVLVHKYKVTNLERKSYEHVGQAVRKMKRKKKRGRSRKRGEEGGGVKKEVFPAKLRATYLEKQK